MQLEMSHDLLLPALALPGWMAFGLAAVGLPILANFRRQLLSLSTPTRIMRIQCLAVFANAAANVNNAEPTKMEKKIYCSSIYREKCNDAEVAR